MRIYARSDIGSRDINEDSYYAPEEGARFCCVADGMGGHQAGEVASSLAVEIFAKQMGDVIVPIHERLRRAVSAANHAIYEKAAENPEMNGMGTTITALALDGDEAHIAHVGDSRAYLLRNKALMRVTTDHTLVEEMVLKGLISVSEARVHPNRNIITRALGTADKIEIDMLRMHVRVGDMFLLCSDGLSGCVPEVEIAEILNSRMRREAKIAALVDRALDAGGSDNITAILATIEEDDI